MLIQQAVAASSKLWLSVSACLSSFWGVGLPCDLNFLVDLRRVVDSEFFSCFAVVMMEVMISSSLYVQPEMRGLNY